MQSWIGLLLAGMAMIPAHAAAASFPPSLTFTHKHFLFTVSTKHPDWQRKQVQWLYHGQPAVPPQLVTGALKNLPAGWSRNETMQWNSDAIQKTLAKDIAENFDRSAGTVAINRSASGIVMFTGTGLTGRSVDLARAAELTIVALERNIKTVVLPVRETQPTITIDDPELAAMGIREVVTIGESNFAGSPANRRHNIAIGVKRFNGHIIPQGSVFSFGDILGEVGPKQGYLKELVIQGQDTIPDYGGGLCQVSSTAYRGPWEAGLPIVQRKNHSFTVRYYAPQGTDATVYPPAVDLKFKNTTPGALLIQSVTQGDDAYFIYYGTRDGRASEVIGPYASNGIKGSDEIRYGYSTEVRAGEQRKVNDRLDGIDVAWYRLIAMPGSGSTLERYFSRYEPRPLQYLIGVQPGDSRLATKGDLSEPTWLPARP